MRISANPVYKFCPAANCGVSLEQTEGQCREHHDCGNDACPLETDFGQNKFSRALAFLVPGLRSGWAGRPK